MYLGGVANSTEEAWLGDDVTAINRMLNTNDIRFISDILCNCDGDGDSLVYYIV